jgi:membrane protease YdiL (CAAX protease family)
VEAPGTAPGSEEFISTPFIAVAARGGPPNIGASGLISKANAEALAAMPRRTTDLEIRLKVLALIRLCLGLVTIAAIAALILAFAAGLVLAIESVLFPPDTTRAVPGARLLDSITRNDGSGVTLGLLISLFAYTALAVAVLIEARLRCKSDWRDVVAWYPWTHWRTDWRIYLLAVAALVYGFLADSILHYFFPQSGAWVRMPDDAAAALVLTFVAVIAAPIAEELLFRGWIYTDLRRHFGFATTLVLTSAVFAWLHYESTHLYALAVFPIGLALGTMREITSSVKPPIAFHAFNNFLASVLIYLGP